MMKLKILGYLFINLTLLSCVISNANADPWLDEVISFEQPDGSSDEGGAYTSALGENDNIYVSIDVPETLIVAFKNNSVINGAGNDLLIYEEYNGDSSVDVYISQDNINYISLGTIKKNTEFDLSDYSIDYVNYIKFIGVDDGGGYAGFDLDAVKALNSGEHIEDIPYNKPLNEGLILYYKFEENTIDSSNTGINGLHSKETSYEKDLFNYSLKLVDQHLIVPYDSSFNIDNMSICLWLKIYEYPLEGSSKLAIRDDMKTDRIFQLDFYPDGTLSFIAHTIGDAIDETFFDIDIKSSNKLVKNVWYNIIATFDSTFGGKIFVNGLNWGSDETFNGKLASGNIQLEIGGTNYNYGENHYNRNFIGLIDEVRIYNRAISQNEILEIYKYNGFNCLNETDQLTAMYESLSKTYFTLSESYEQLSNVVKEKDNRIESLENQVQSMFTQEQVSNKLLEAQTLCDIALEQKDLTISELLSSMYTKEQLDQAKEEAKIGLYTNEAVELMINKILEWDVNNDGKIGLIEAIQSLKISSGIRPIE